MAQVSRMPLPKALERQMYELFHHALAGLHSEQDIADFLDDLLTPTEKIMLGKRLAIAILLSKGYDQRTVHRIMKVSLGTVNSVNFWLKQKGKGYRKVIEKVQREEQRSAAIEKLDRLVEEFVSLAKYPLPKPPKELQPQDRI